MITERPITGFQGWQDTTSFYVARESNTDYGNFRMHRTAGQMLSAAPSILGLVVIMPLVQFLRRRPPTMPLSSRASLS
jgi:hypothetical protein